MIRFIVWKCNVRVLRHFVGWEEMNTFIFVKDRNTYTSENKGRTSRNRAKH